MERLLRLHFAAIVQGDTADPMTISYANELERNLKQWYPDAKTQGIPWASMTKSRAISHACRLLQENPQAFVFAQRTSADSLTWSAERERRLVLGRAETISEAILALDHTLASPVAFVGASCRGTCLQSRMCTSTHEHMPHLWVRDIHGVWHNVHTRATKTQNDAFKSCTKFCSIPNTDIVVGVKGKGSVIVGPLETPSFRATTSVRNPDMVECEVIPSGSIVISLSFRNEDTGGAIQTETMAFRLDENEALVPVKLSSEEVASAESEADKREENKHFDFAYVSCPLSARIESPWHSDIVLQEDIVFSDDNHGSVIGLMGHASELWIAHATGIVVHVLKGDVQERIDLGIACDASVTLPASS